MPPAGEPVKPVSIAVENVDGTVQHRQGEFVVTSTGIEGSLVYAMSSAIRDRLLADGNVTLRLDLAPGLSAQRVTDEVTRPRGSRSMSSHLHSRIGITGVKLGLLHECLSKEDFTDAAKLAQGAESQALDQRVGFVESDFRENRHRALRT